MPQTHHADPIDKPFFRAGSIAVLCVASCFLSACPTRSYTKPRSTIIDEAKDDGLENIRSLEEERQIFEEYQQKNREKLYTVLAAREKEMDLSADPEYIVGPGDKISVEVFGVDELRSEVRIEESGYVVLPLIGAVKIDGLSEEEVQNLLVSKYASQVRSPQISIEITEYGSHKVDVLGEVRQPGSIALQKGRNSLVHLLGAAGGITERSGNFVTFIPAPEDEKGRTLRSVATRTLEGSAADGIDSRRGIELPLTAVLGTNGQQPIEVPIKGGDTIIVSAAGQVLVEGEVEQRGAYALGQNMTLLGALAAARGVRYSALISEVEVVRKLDDRERVVLVYDLQDLLSGEAKNPLLKAGDLVRVPSNNGKRFSEDVMTGIQRMINFGIGGTFRMSGA